jgi:hypothetical protein
MVFLLEQAQACSPTANGLRTDPSEPDTNTIQAKIVISIIDGRLLTSLTRSEGGAQSTAKQCARGWLGWLQMNCQATAALRTVEAFEQGKNLAAMSALSKAQVCACRSII